MCEWCDRMWNDPPNPTNPLGEREKKKKRKRGTTNVEIKNVEKPSPGYAGVSLSLAKTELNAP